MIELFSNLATLTDIEIIQLFFKLFGVVFTFLYFIYTIILVRQTDVLNRALSTSQRNGINFVSVMLLIVGIAVFLYSIFLL